MFRKLLKYFVCVLMIVGTGICIIIVSLNTCQKITKGNSYVSFLTSYKNQTALSQEKFSENTPGISRQVKYNWNYSGNFNIEHHQFAQSLNDTEFKWYMDLISVFQNRCEEFGLMYFLESGSLLGAYRFHGFIPWDDDFDVRMDYSQRSVIAKALDSVPGHTLFKDNNFIWKFINKKNSLPTTKPWNWPFVDILFSQINATHISDISTGKPRRFEPIGDILPVDYTAFENLIMPVPRNIEACLNRRYDMKNSCVSSSWDHRRDKETEEKPKKIPCKMLYGIYPFVYRYKNKKSFPAEELCLGNKVLYRIQRGLKVVN